MPFIAINNTGDRVCSLDRDDLRPMYRQGSLKCPLCGDPVYYKHGVRMRSHFAHKAACTADYEHKPESQEHLEAKSQLRDLLRKKYPKASVELEMPFPEIKRVADILFDINGWKKVFEIQFSPITVENLAQRTADYESLGMDVEWCFGEKALTPSVEKWCVKEYREFARMIVHGKAI